jgi:hypothetical protein
MADTVADILKELDSLSIEDSIEIFVPSLQQNVKFKKLTLKQQKDLLKTSIDENLVKLAFNILLSSIIAENIIDKVDVNSLYTLDRAAIAVSIRAKSLDNKYRAAEDKEINLNELVNLYSTLPLDKTKLQQVTQDNNFTVLLGAPSLSVDKELSTYAINRMKSAPTNDLKLIVGELVIYELIKFIKSLKIQDKEIFFGSLTVKERVAIAEKLPSTITNKIFDFVKQYRDIETQYVKLDDTIIDIDGNFFTV